jgi:hypothetical protein
MEVKKWVILACILNTLATTAQTPKGYFTLDGGYTKDLNFSFSTLAHIGRVAGEFEYFYSNHGELLSLSAGALPINEDNWKMIVNFGTEINNGWNPRMSTEFWRRVGRGDGWIKAGVQTVDSEPYLSLGLAIGIHPRKTKPTRFF